MLRDRIVTKVLAPVAAYIVTAVVLTLPMPTSAQRAKVGMVDAVEGVVTVTRQTAESRSLGSKDDVLMQDTIMTASESMVRIRFAPGVTVEMRGRSVMTIFEEAGEPVLRLHSGALYYRGSLGRNRRGEAQTILTSNAIVRAAGSLVIGADLAPDTEPVTGVWVKEGSGFAAVLGGANVEVREGNSVLIVGNVVGPVSPFPPPRMLLPYYLPGSGSSRGDVSR